MSEVVTIKRIYRDEKNGKFGPSTLTSIYTNEYPDTRMSSFQKGLDGLKEGDKLNIEIQKKGDFTNFKAMGVGGSAPSVAAAPAFDATDILRRLDRLEGFVFDADSFDKAE